MTNHWNPQCIEDFVNGLDCNAYSTTLRSVLRRYSIQAQDQEDLLQESLLNAYRHFSTYTVNTSFKSWLCTIVRNSSINFVRRKNIFEKREVPLEETCDDFIADNKTPESIYCDAQIAPVLIMAYNNLPYSWRQIFALYAEGDSYKEIAERTHTPIGTVMSRIHRAKKKMQQELAS